MADLKGSKTEQSLKDAFAGESQANRRYLYFANKADVEGQNDVAIFNKQVKEKMLTEIEGESSNRSGGDQNDYLNDPAVSIPGIKPKKENQPAGSGTKKQKEKEVGEELGDNCCVGPAIVNL